MVSHCPGFVCSLIKAELHEATREYLICQLSLAQVFVNYGFNCTASKANIALLAEGSEVEFRKLELTPIKKLTGK